MAASGIDRLTIAHVTPLPWGQRHEINEFVAWTSAELAERGHRVVVAAPSSVGGGTREARRLIETARERPEALFNGSWRGERAGDGGPPVLAVGTGLKMPRGARPRGAPLPLDVSKGLDALLGGVEFDVVHVHDPFAPSAASLALRHSRSLNVGSFHEPSERVLSTQVARPLVEVFFGRLDARTASCGETADLMRRYFPGSYELVQPGTRSLDGAWPGPPRVAEEGPLRIAYCLEEERGALRLFMRALRRLPAALDWEAAVWLPDGGEVRMSKRLRERVQVVGPRAMEPEALVAAADVVCLASGGPMVAPGLIRAALGAGTVPVVSQLPVYDELVLGGELGLMFQPGDAITMAGQIERLASSVELRDGFISRAAGVGRDWGAVADQVEEIYRRLAARRHDPRGDAQIRRRISRRKQIGVDLHMHTDHSPDCATPVRTLLETARDQGLGAIAITDHNEVSGALEAREIADEVGIKVIVAEEVKTAEQGEVIGLFLDEKIERGMTMAETIAEIRRQNGLVYVPHPFDRLHSVPDYEHLLDMVEEIDILEVFNPRVALTAFNEEAERFASKYRIVPGAGSDSHVAQGLGSVMIRVHDFEGPQEFLQAMRDADIVRKHKNLVYVQALKFIQTSGGRGGRGAPEKAGKA
ncbi:MAG TPA: PHP domain-containing protein [Solirubrobacterales bacterium]|nr:PHP domain-containing protein [Solirubrobacterales bacterium]